MNVTGCIYIGKLPAEDNMCSNKNLANAQNLKIKQLHLPVFDSTSQKKLHAMDGQRVITILGEITDKSK